MIKLRAQHNTNNVLIPPQRVVLNSHYKFEPEFAQERRFEEAKEIEVSAITAKSQQAGESVAFISSKISGLLSGDGYNATRCTSNLNIESLLGAELSRSAEGIVERIIGRNPNMFQASAGRFLSQSVERFGKALNEGRIRDFEDAFTSVLGGKNGAMGFATDIGNQVMGGLLQTGLDKLFGAGKTTTSSFESARSLQAAQNYRMSRGQQAAEALTQLHKGQRNL